MFDYLPNTPNHLPSLYTPLDSSPFLYTPLDYLLLNLYSYQLPKPTPTYANLFHDLLYNCQQQSVIKSTNDLNCLPKCASPTISCQQSNEPSSTTLAPTNDTKSVKSRRLSYTREYKLLVINHYLANGQNKYRTCKMFHITKSMLNGWLQKSDKILNSREGAKKTGSSGRRPQFPNIEEKLYELCVEKKAKGCQVENRWIREKARELTNEQNQTSKFSERWLKNFKKRFNI